MHTAMPARLAAMPGRLSALLQGLPDPDIDAEMNEADGTAAQQQRTDAMDDDAIYQAERAENRAIIADIYRRLRAPTPRKRRP